MVSTAFSDLLGHPQAVELLTQAIARQRIAPAYLFAGPAGVGRSLAARYFIELLLTKPGGSPLELGHRVQQRNHPDLLWVEPTVLHQGKRLTLAEATAAGIKRKSAEIRLEQVREISRFLSRPSLEAPRSIVVLEQAETMAEAAANGLLKTLEEPGRATVILLAPGVESLLSTLVSRCQRIPFYRLPHPILAQILQQAGYGELLANPTVLALAEGSPGAAIAHWQQLQAIPPGLLQKVAQPLPTLRLALELAREIDKTLETDQQLWLVNYLQHFYWHGRASAPCLKLLEKTRQAILSYVQPRLVWEVTLMQLQELSLKEN